MSFALEIHPKHKAAQPTKGAPIDVQREQIDIDEFELFMKQCGYDTDVWRIYKKKYANNEAANYNKKREWRLEREEHCKQLGSQWFKDRVKLIVWDKAEMVIREVQTHKRATIDKHNMEPENVIQLPCLNWCAPCSVPAAIQTSQAGLMAYVVNDGPNNFGVVLMPTFSYKKGQQWLVEKNALTLLSKGNVNLDNVFYVPFVEQTDFRDDRPMSYPGRILTSMVDNKKFIFAKSHLFRLRRTEPVAQMASRDMTTVEDVSPESVPTTTDDALSCVKGAMKYMQVGSGAWGVMLDAALKDVEFNPRSALIIYDLNVKVPQLLLALIEKVQSLNIVLVYVGLVDDMIEYEYVTEVAIRKLTNLISEGTMKVGTAVVGEVDMPPDRLEDPPKMPTLNVLVTGGSKTTPQLQIPAHVIQKYSQHAVFGEKFRSFMDSFHDEFGLAEEVVEVADTPGDNNKRPRPANGLKPGLPTPPSKKNKVDGGRIVELSTLTGTKLQEANIVNVKKADTNLKLQTRVGDKHFVVNMCGCEVVLPIGLNLMTFGKGRFKIFKQDHELAATRKSVNWLLSYWGLSGDCLGMLADCLAGDSQLVIDCFKGFWSMSMSHGPETLSSQQPVANQPAE